MSSSKWAVHAAFTSARSRLPCDAYCMRSILLFICSAAELFKGDERTAIGCAYCFLPAQQLSYSKEMKGLQLVVILCHLNPACSMCAGSNSRGHGAGTSFNVLTSGFSSIVLHCNHLHHARSLSERVILRPSATLLFGIQACVNITEHAARVSIM